MNGWISSTYTRVSSKHIIVRILAIRFFFRQIDELDTRSTTLFILEPAAQVEIRPPPAERPQFQAGQRPRGPLLPRRREKGKEQARQEEEEQRILAEDVISMGREDGWIEDRFVQQK